MGTVRIRVQTDVFGFVHSRSVSIAETGPVMKRATQVSENTGAFDLVELLLEDLLGLHHERSHLVRFSLFRPEDKTYQNYDNLL